MQIGFDDEDPIRKFTAEEEADLTQNLTALVRQVRTLDGKAMHYSVDLFRFWHARLFGGIREHAGRYRSRDYGETFITFGEHRSSDRDHVSNLLEKHVSEANKYFLQLNDITDEKKLISEVIKIALYLHAKFIQIHPFRDGNGRVGRLILTFVLVRYGLPSISMEVPKQEYIDCLNHFYKRKDIEPLYKLAIRLYGNQI